MYYAYIARLEHIGLHTSQSGRYAAYLRRRSHPTRQKIYLDVINIPAKRY